MAGVYIHIPFCRKACHYCDFHFSTQLNNQNRVSDALVREIALKKDRFPGKLQTVYFGGGTPSLLSRKELQSILNALPIHDYRPTELTLEANPEDITESKLDEWHQLGINRLSIGIQSFDDNFLSSMNRNHDVALAKEKLALVQNGPIRNFTADLMFGKPRETKETLKAEMEQLLRYEPKHISVYCLTVEEGTALHHLDQKGEFKAPTENHKSEHFHFIVDTLKAAGIHQYEVSNFAQPGFESLHNGNYWEGEPYIGIGPGAHEFDGNATRRWNVSNNARYLKAIEAGELPEELETLSFENQWNERFLVALRRLKGLDLAQFERDFGAAPLAGKEALLDDLLQKKWIHLSEDRMWLTTDGLLMADHIASQFFK